MVSQFDVKAFMEKRKRARFLEEAASRLNSNPDQILKQVENLKREIEEMKKEMGE